MFVESLPSPTLLVLVLFLGAHLYIYLSFCVLPSLSLSISYQTCSYSASLERLISRYLEHTDQLAHHV